MSVVIIEFLKTFSTRDTQLFIHNNKQWSGIGFTYNTVMVK